MINMFSGMLLKVDTSNLSVGHKDMAGRAAPGVLGMRAGIPCAEMAAIRCSMLMMGEASCA